MDTRRLTEDAAGVLDGTPRSTGERNVSDMPGSAAAVESLWRNGAIDLLALEILMIACLSRFSDIKDAKKNGALSAWHTALDAGSFFRLRIATNRKAFGSAGSGVPLFRAAVDMLLVAGTDLPSPAEATCL